MKTRAAVAVLLLLLTLIAASPARGASGVPLDLLDLVRLSDEIVLGTVVETTPHWNAEQTMIVTDVRIEVHESVMGNISGELIIEHPGGIVGAIRVEIPGVAGFYRGQEAVLCLSSRDRIRPVVTGLSAGRFDVREDPETGERTIERLHWPELRSGMQTPATPVSPVVNPLETFLGELRDAVEQLGSEGGAR